MGSESLQCGEDGKCTCKDNVCGDKCDKACPEYYDVDDPKGIFIKVYIKNNILIDVSLECNCNVDGSEDKNCDDEGRCNCKCNIKGDKCDECNSEYYGFPDCFGMKFFK